MRRRLILLSLLCAALIATGSGSQESPRPTASDPFEGASSRIVATWRSDFPVLNEIFRVTGLVDYERGKGMIESTSDSEFEPEIFTPEASYALLTNIGYQPIDERRWLESDPPESALQWFEPFVIEYFGENPAEMLSFLKAAGEVETTTKGEERGEPVTRYRIRLKLERALEEIAVPQRRWFRHDFGSCWGESQKTGVPFDLAVDAVGRLRRLDVTMSCKRGVEWTMELFDYGVEVRANVPPADQVMTHEELDRLELQLAGEDEDR
jgi:hypothetical protein